MATQINQISFPTTAKADNDFGISQITIPLAFEYDFVLPEANGLHWSTGDATRLSDSLHKNSWVNCYETKLDYCQPVRFNDTSNIQVMYGDGSDALTLHFFKIDGSAVDTVALTITDGLATASWNWQTLGYAYGDIAYIELRGSTSGLRATSEPIRFMPDNCLLKLSYRNKFDKDQLGQFVGNNFRHITYVPGKASPDYSEDVESYTDAAGKLFNYRTTQNEVLNLKTDAIPPYMVSIFGLAFIHSDLQINSVAVTKEGVMDRERLEEIDMFMLSQLLRVNNKTVQFNY